MVKQISTKEKILNILDKCSSEFLAVHEIPDRYFIEMKCYISASENGIASRLSELENEGKVRGRIRDGKRFKEWAIKYEPVQIDLFQTAQGE